MDRFNEPPYDGFDYQITSFERHKDGTAYIKARCDNGARIDADLSFCLDSQDDGETITPQDAISKDIDDELYLQAFVSIGGKNIGDAKYVRITPSVKEEISVKDAEKCLDEFLDRYFYG